MGSLMKYKPFVFKDKTWKRLCFGVNRFFTISIYSNGFTIDICHFGTILKKVSYSFGVCHYQKIIY